tara:strand:+ start:262 stop:546 length:285 start_codon:yes stop_codon:yes gene_type:complete
MDKRKNNGGNSTKAKGIDRRKNPYKDILNDALSEEQLLEVVRMLHNKATKDFDVAASKILMEYYLGKPVQTIDQNNTHTVNDFNIKDLLKFDKP